jgi:hypothetical protein
MEVVTAIPKPDWAPEYDEQPPAKPAPLPRLTIPKPDWAAEAKERAASQLEADTHPEQSYPAPRRRRDGPRPTPRLDAVRAWRQETP